MPVGVFGIGCIFRIMLLSRGSGMSDCAGAYMKFFQLPVLAHIQTASKSNSPKRYGLVAAPLSSVPPLVLWTSTTKCPGYWRLASIGSPSFLRCVLTWTRTSFSFFSSKASNDSSATLFPLQPLIVGRTSRQKTASATMPRTPLWVKSGERLIASRMTSARAPISFSYG